ncbi:MAG: hypothetical protein ACI9CV_000177 [Ilumatobacter sp.]
MTRARRTGRSSTWLGLLAVALAVALVGMAAVLTAACSSDTVPETSVVTAISVPAGTIAGEEMTVTVDALGVGDVRLDVIDAFATTTLTRTVATSIVESIDIEVPAYLTRSSGVVTFRAYGAAGDDVSSSTVVVPARVVDPLDIVVGPRTIVANGADETMVVAFATDRFGNPLLDGTQLTMTLVDELTGSRVVESRIDGGLAAQLIGSRIVAQRVEVFASTVDSSVASRRVVFHEVPAPAADVSLVAVLDHEDPLVADGRSRLEVRTVRLADANGNALIDGRLVRVQTVGPDGLGQLTARTIDGAARFELAAPSRPGVVTLTAAVDGLTGSPIELTYAAAVSELPVEVSRDGDFVSVAVGPVRDAAGAVVVDGTVAVAAVSGVGSDADVRTLVEIQLLDGRGIAHFDVLESSGADSGELTVTVLGVATSEAWP